MRVMRLLFRSGRLPLALLLLDPCFRLCLFVGIVSPLERDLFDKDDGQEDRYADEGYEKVEARVEAVGWV